MKDILFIKGNVKYPITLDPGVWIFDDRKVDLTAYFKKEHKEADHLEAYKKAISSQWDREIREGAIFPPTLKTEKKFEKEKILNGTFGIQLKPFLENAEIGDDATNVAFLTADGVTTLTLEEANEAILAFSHNGKPLKEDGPVHLYFGNGRNQSNPIKYVLEIHVM
ncbi:peptidyl-prolyl cis-trans isomerase [Metabacillus sp. RGM 3146]|uniref:peptidyl-prolyl cis-trans isomerase n=1 Tax=Metabacillus sp. RGM 3146 TaxID=3401092 RepID=UPI003B9A0C3F